MSTRWYQIFQKGNPQLRIFLPNFWMKLIKPKYPVPENQVHFIIPIEMTKFDVKNYLEKIYNVPVVDVRIAIEMGEIKKQQTKGYIIKDDDYKVAYITLPEDQKFEFPNLFPKEKKEEQEKDIKQLEELEKEYRRSQFQNKDRPFVPSWFGL